MGGKEEGISFLQPQLPPPCNVPFPLLQPRLWEERTYLLYSIPFNHKPQCPPYPVSILHMYLSYRRVSLFSMTYCRQFRNKPAGRLGNELRTGEEVWVFTSKRLPPYPPLPFSQLLSGLAPILMNSREIIRFAHSLDWPLDPVVFGCCVVTTFTTFIIFISISFR